MESFNNIKQWMSEIDQYANDSVCKLLVGNKCDLAESRAVETAVAQVKFLNYPRYSRYFIVAIISSLFKRLMCIVKFVI
jgi:GTPase SAR1 family protein